MPSTCDSVYRPIGDYALIGDCHTAALVSKDGSIDWYCPGRFDAPAVFCRLLDARRGGYLSVAPVAAYADRRRYCERTNVLETTFFSTEGTVRLTDFMPVHRPAAESTGQGTPGFRGICRLVEVLAGTLDVEVRFKPTFDYARAAGDVEPTPNGAVARGGAHQLTLTCPGVSLAPAEDGSFRGRFRLTMGERRWLTLTAALGAKAPQGAPTSDECESLLQQTRAYWDSWAEKCTYRGPYRSKVLRSALALKLMTYEPTGAIVAAPTTSLPEEIGGSRNWDYRYTWLRDSSVVIYALMAVGHADDAGAFYNWLMRTLDNQPAGHPQILYTIDGRPEVTESTLPNLEGYRCSAPVRIGNGAATQRQLDVYGEILASVYIYGVNQVAEGAKGQPYPGPSEPAWTHIRRLVDLVVQDWHEPDSGIWEVRGGILQPFLYSRLMCWVALEAALRVAHYFRLAAPVDLWTRTRDTIRQEILNRGYNAQLGAFTQAFGSTTLDASALLLPAVGFLPPTDPRVRSTVERIRTELTRDGLVYRYLGPDGLIGSEAPFTLCTFWLVNALAMGGDLDDAYDLFEKVTDYANDVGLLAEEIDPATGEQIGNFPQAFSHVGLINSTANLALAERQVPNERPEMLAERLKRARAALPTANLVRRFKKLAS
ncbi:MAG TPA: glycoside hydrolase family 15 protein [Chloroflexota bacterium]|nr:glycoside hydrolase family 15 protein [Chloroflexota bacterium]